MKLTTFFILSTLLILSQAAVSEEEKQAFETCHAEKCAPNFITINGSATPEQKTEFYKQYKCSFGMKFSDDTEGVSDSITQSEVCVTAQTDQHKQGECWEGCKNTHLMAGNPYIEYVSCQVECVNSSTSFSSVLSVSMMVFAIVVTLL